ncbi:MAG: LysR family transcriptional regulator, partial [Myxococcota bacterium]
MRAPIEFSELEAFTRIVDAKSLSRAAAELGVPRATIGRRLSRLEQRLGVRLLKRTTRSLGLTDAGEAFYRQARIAIDAVQQAAASVRVPGDELCGELRVSLPAIIDDEFENLLLDFAAKNSRVKLTVDVSTRFVDLHRDGYDVAIRAGTTLEPGLIARTLARTRLLAVASRRYIEQHGRPKTKRDLARHKCLSGFMRGELPQPTWPLAKGGKLAVATVFSSNSMALLLSATRRHLGIGFLPDMLVQPYLTSGELVAVLPGVLETPVRLAVVYRERELMPPAQRAFIDA